MPFLFRRLMVSLVACATVGAMSVSGAQTPSYERCFDGATLEHALQRLNALRERRAPCAASSRASPLRWEPHLSASAWAPAVDLASRDTVSHLDSEQRPLDVRLRAAGYLVAAGAENIAVGQPDFEAALAAWLAGPSRCANLPSYTDAGIACARRPDSRYEVFWVLHLGLPVRRP